MASAKALPAPQRAPDLLGFNLCESLSSKAS